MCRILKAITIRYGLHSCSSGGVSQIKTKRKPEPKIFPYSARIKLLHLGWTLRGGLCAKQSSEILLRNPKSPNRDMRFYSLTRKRLFIASYLSSSFLKYYSMISCLRLTLHGIARNNIFLEKAIIEKFRKKCWGRNTAAVAQFSSLCQRTRFLASSISSYFTLWAGCFMGKKIDGISFLNTKNNIIGKWIVKNSFFFEYEACVDITLK